MRLVLKWWKMLGWAAVLAVGLAACSTPPTGYPPEFGPGSPPPPIDLNLFITQFELTNSVAEVPSIPPAEPTNTRFEPAPDNIPSPTAIRATNAVEGSTWVAWDSWGQTTGWGRPERLRNTPTFTYELRGTKGALAVTAGNRTALWNGLNLELGFAPKLTNGQPHLHTLDLSKTFEPLAIEPELLRRSDRIIVIDPGHGGFNYGAKSLVDGRLEKEFTLDWAFRTERLLSLRGWKVYLTRTNDVDISLADRVAFADRVGANLFISLHFNSTDQPQNGAEQGGLETYCLTPAGMPSSLTRRFDDELNQVYPNNSFDTENYHFAARLHRSMVETTRRKDRGVRRARFMGVLRGQNRPAVLLEGGYLSNPAEARLIATAQFRQKLAEAVAKALSE